jgi:Holliday junction resolvase RusA-like endonuclease
MEKIRNGEMVMKLTAGDLDNLIKPVNDSMNDLVFKDDAIVHSIDGLKKYYGMGGCVIIDMIGK